MHFNGIDLSLYLDVNEIVGRGISEHTVSTVEIAGMDGAHFSSRRRPTRTIEVQVTIKASDAEDLRKRIDELNEVFDVKEPCPIQFDDEPEMVYYGVPESVEESAEFVTYHQAKIVFLCTDPYKYGREVDLAFPADIVSVRNEGSASAFPIFTFEVREPITYAMIQNDREQYQMIGTPSDDDFEVVDSSTSVFYENGSTIDAWTKAHIDLIDDPNVGSVSGTMGTDGAGIRPSSWGTVVKGKQRGAAVLKELPKSVQDFEIESTFDILSSNKESNFRMMIYMYDENMNNLGQFGVKDNSRVYKRRVPLATAGPHSTPRGSGRVLGDASWHNNNARDTTLMYLRAKRNGRLFSFYIAEWKNHRHDIVWQGSYHDVKNKFGGKLKYISIFIGTFEDRPRPSRIRMNSIEVFETATTLEDQTPYIARKGDIITFDHKSNELLINGENRADLKDFGGEFFDLRQGPNQLIVSPEGALITSVSFRERYK